MNITELLRVRAGELEAQSVQIINTYDFGLVKSAAMSKLVENGVDIEAAEIVLDNLRDQYLPPEAGAMLEKAAFLEKEAKILSTAADVIDELGTKIKLAEDMQKEASVNPGIDMLKSKYGLNEDDVNGLKSLPVETLTKIASTQEPWVLGKASNRQSASDSDPMYVFLTS